MSLTRCLTVPFFTAALFCFAGSVFAAPITISLSDSAWSSVVTDSAHATNLVSSSNTAASNGMSVSVDSGFGSPGWADSSTLGHISAGAWVDSISQYGYTIWSFSQAIYSFGADFNISGTDGLTFQTSGTSPYSTAPMDGFFSFASSVPFTQVMITWSDPGSALPCYGASYTMTDLQVSTAPTPEPAYTPVFALLAFISVCASSKKLRHNVILAIKPPTR